MPADNTNDQKDIKDANDTVRDTVNDSVSLVTLGGSAPPTPPLLANCTSAVMMDQVLELHVASGYGLLQQFRSGADNRPEIQKHIASNNQLIPYLSHYAADKTKDMKKIETDSSLPSTQLL